MLDHFMNRLGTKFPCALPIALTACESKAEHDDAAAQHYTQEIRKRDHERMESSKHLSFPAKQAMQTALARDDTMHIITNGEVSGSGQPLTLIQGNVTVLTTALRPISYEGAHAEQSTTEIRATFTLSAAPDKIPLEISITDYYDANFVFLRFSAPHDYCVAARSQAFPASLKLGPRGKSRHSTAVRTPPKPLERQGHRKPGDDIRYRNERPHHPEECGPANKRRRDDTRVRRPRPMTAAD
jgi:hypothetical protein